MPIVFSGKENASLPKLDPAALLRDAARLKDEGKLDQAAECCARMLALIPSHPQALLLLGHIHLDRKNWKESETVFLKSRNAYPENPKFHAGLGTLYLRRGRPDAALAPLRQAILLDPAFEDAKKALVKCLGSLRFRADDPDLRTAMTSCLETESLSCEDMAQAWCGLLLLAPDMQEALAVFNAPDYATFRREATPEFFIQLQDNRLFVAGLKKLVVCDPLLERGLIYVRRWFLDNTERCDALTALLCALAQQCFLNEYVWVESAEESECLQIFSIGVPTHAALFACYRPLKNLYPSPFLDDNRLAEIIKTQIDEPLEEDRIQETILSLSPITDSISLKVRSQYEENPYPRWRGINVLRPDKSGAMRGRDILIAGCGTGREAAEVALQYPDAHVTAIDLSLRSLAYAIRQCRDMGIENITFRQADILGLPTSDKSFDLIVCSGVLQHMNDLMEGWRCLLSVLKPRGVMKIALYSKAAREPVRQARAFIAEQNIPPTTAGIRDARARIMTMGETSPMNILAFAGKDFYTLSQCRDLLFHIQGEPSFTLPQIRDMGRSIGLVPLRIDLKQPQMINLYKEMFPRSPDMLDLDHWHRLEQKHPYAFSRMISLWFCRTNDLKAIDASWIADVGAA